MNLVGSFNKIDKYWYKINMHTMEFPPEIIRHINEYAKPMFPYWQEAKRVIENRHFDALRRALLGGKSLYVREELKEYLNAIQHVKYCKESLRAYKLSLGMITSTFYFSRPENHYLPLTWQQQNALTDAIEADTNARQREESQYRKLMAWVYINGDMDYCDDNGYDD